jgi:hypothetical protein
MVPVIEQMYGYRIDWEERGDDARRRPSREPKPGLVWSGHLKEQVQTARFEVLNVTIDHAMADVNDQASDLNRPGVFRLNVGVSRKTFKSLFGNGKKEWDFTELDCLMPHPVYARNLWVCALNPGDETWAALQPLLQESYATAVKKQARREAASSRRSSE